MKSYDIVCPVCGTVNKNLYLEETERWMEGTIKASFPNLCSLFLHRFAEIVPFLPDGSWFLTN